MSTKSETVVILGASNKPDRYSHKALTLLRQHGHRPVPVHPSLPEIEGIPVAASLADVARPVDTLTLYVRPEISEHLTGEILDLKPGRVIFNPGTESPALAASLTEKGIPYEEACTLVLLNTGQF